ncbi:unnamed protein product [Caenorhabditis angaria]|uniref:Uncharacterized protein n=1 Tax=Caenorhabditis angaria TaxID=860376 RepID=A0A9P1N8J3_9PELO|nr:unnamed protein product [Caenorhabditis angaria]
MEIYTTIIALFLVLLQVGSIFSVPISNEDANAVVTSNIEESENGRLKRGGGRAFYGFANSKRGSDVGVEGSLPYFLYQKRGGGRSFGHNRDLYGFDKRAGGRAFGGSWSPYLERFNDFKRSADGYPIYYSDNFFY